MQYVIVFVTASDKVEAQKISKALLDRRVAACVNIVGKVDSYFWWKGKKEKARECLLIAKTKRPLIRKLIKIVQREHSYDIPEIIAVPIITGHKSYLDWIEEATR